MLRQLFKNKANRGQNTAEYALLIALVIAGVIAMQTYAQRSLQGRVRDAGIYLTEGTSTIGNSVQYEPYYVNSSYDVTRDVSENKLLGEGLAATGSFTNRQRTGAQSSEYGTTGVTAETDHSATKPMPGPGKI